MIRFFIKAVKAQINKHPKLWEIFKFLVIGTIATIIDFIVMGVVLYIWQPSIYNNFIDVAFGKAEPAAAAAIIGTAVGFTVGLIFNYIFSIIWVYTGKGNSSARAKTINGFIMFALLSCLGLSVHVIGMWLGYDILRINAWIVKITLTTIIMIFNYTTRKLLIFKASKQTNQPASMEAQI